MKKTIQLTGLAALILATAINVTGSEGVIQIYAYLLSMILLPIGWRMEGGK